MARKTLGKLYRINQNLHITIRGMVRSTGFGGQKLACFLCRKGTENLFRQENLPDQFSDIHNPSRKINSKWFIQGEIIALVSELPEEIKQQYKLGDYNLVHLQLVDEDVQCDEQW